MGKIRVKTLGIEELEKEEKLDSKKRKDGKKTVKAPGMKGGERVVAVGPTEEELEALEHKEEKKGEVVGKKLSKAKSASGGEAKAPRSKNYQTAAKIVDKSKTYSLNEALKVLSELQRGKFDETVELHVNTLSSGISGQVTLPHGTGKKTRVAIANDALIAEIEKGVISFDILLSVPDMMPKLAKVARVLGPKGLMPNPKNGTITDKPEEIAKKYEGGQISFKTEAKSPIIHLTVGKISFGPEKLSENIEYMLNAIKKTNIINATLKSTMSPGIKLKT